MTSSSVDQIVRQNRVNDPSNEFYIPEKVSVLGVPDGIFDTTMTRDQVSAVFPEKEAERYHEESLPEGFLKNRAYKYHGKSSDASLPYEEWKISLAKWASFSSKDDTSIEVINLVLGPAPVQHATNIAMFVGKRLDPFPVLTSSDLLSTAGKISYTTTVTKTQSESWGLAYSGKLSVKVKDVGAEGGVTYTHSQTNSTSWSVGLQQSVDLPQPDKGKLGRINFVGIGAYYFGWLYYSMSTHIDHPILGAYKWGSDADNGFELPTKFWYQGFPAKIFVKAPQSSSSVIWQPEYVDDPRSK